MGGIHIKCFTCSRILLHRALIELVQYHNAILMNPTSILQAISVKLHLLDVSEHPKGTPDYVSVPMNLVINVDDCLLMVQWQWTANVLIILGGNSAIFKLSTSLKHCSLADSSSQCINKQSTCFCGYLNVSHRNWCICVVPYCQKFYNTIM